MNQPSSKLHAFLAAIREFPNISHAAEAAGISRSTHYDRYDKDPAYAKTFHEAWRWGMGFVRDVAVHRAVHGYQEPVIFQGQYQYTGKGKKRRLVTVTKYPERLFMKVLTAEIPEVYNRNRMEHTGPDGGPIQKHITVEFVKP